MKWKYLLILIIAVHIFLISNISFFPNSELFVYPYLTNRGLIPYKDIWDQHTPGLFFFPVNFDNLGMNTPDDALHWHLIVIAINQILIFVLSKEIFKAEKRALLVNFLYLIIQPLYEGYIQWLDVFLPIFFLSSMFFYLRYLDKQKIIDLIVAGLIMGVGIVFKQVVLPFAAIGGLLILLRRNIKEVLVLGISMALPVLLMIFYLVRLSALDDFWYWAVTYNLTTFARSGTKAIPSVSHLVRFVAIYGLAIYYFVINLKDKKSLVLGLGFIASLATVMARFDFVHLQASLPFALIVIVVGFSRDRNWVRKVGLMGIYGLFLLGWMIGFYYKHWGGEVMFFDENIYRVEATIEELTEPGEEIFLFGSPTHLYQMSETLPVGRVFVFQFPWFMEVAQDELLGNLEMRKPRVVVRNRSMTMQGLKLIDYGADLDKYIASNYDVLERYGEDEIMIRK